MSKGQEAMAILQQMFGRPIDPNVGMRIIVMKMNEQDGKLEFLKNLVCAMALDHGVLMECLDRVEGTAPGHGWESAEVLQLFGLPVADLKEKIAPVQDTPRLVLG